MTAATAERQGFALKTAADIVPISTLRADELNAPPLPGTPDRGAPVRQIEIRKGNIAWVPEYTVRRKMTIHLKRRQVLGGIGLAIPAIAFPRALCAAAWSESRSHRFARLTSTASLCSPLPLDQVGLR